MFYPELNKYTKVFDLPNEVWKDVIGQSDDIYCFEVSTGCKETIESLQPYEGTCGEDSFYDF